jgi:hypothetical protein
MGGTAYTSSESNMHQSTWQLPLSADYMDALHFSTAYGILYRSSLHPLQFYVPSFQEPATPMPRNSAVLLAFDSPENGIMPLQSGLHEQVYSLQLMRVEAQLTRIYRNITALDPMDIYISENCKGNSAHGC